MKTINKKMMIDLFTNACEGGSNYWCAAITSNMEYTSKEKDCYSAMADGFDCVDSQTGRTIKVTPEMIEKAIPLMKGDSPNQFQDALDGNDDAETADVFLQFCVFGRVVYG